MSTLIETARGFQAELMERAAEIEAARRLPQDIADRFARAGFYRMCLPKAYGGLALPPRETMAVLQTLAEADGSAAWVAMICSTTASLAAFLPPAFAREVWSDPDVIACGVAARRGKAHDDGDVYRIEGRWPWGSGSDTADWIGLGVVLHRDGAPVLAGEVPVNGIVWLRKADVSLAGNWDTSGLCGTGSQDLIVANMRVPKSRGELGGRPASLDEPIARFPSIGLLACGVVSVMLGLARAAIREGMTIAGVKIPEAHRRVLAQRSRTQEDVAQAEAHLRAGRAFFNEMLDQAWVEAQAGPVPLSTRRDLRLAVTHAAREAARSVDLMYALGGGTSVYKTSPLQRIFRDTHVATQHMQVATPTMETAGRLILGLEADTAMF